MRQVNLFAFFALTSLSAAAGDAFASRVQHDCILASGTVASIERDGRIAHSPYSGDPHYASIVRSVGGELDVELRVRGSPAISLREQTGRIETKQDRVSIVMTRIENTPDGALSSDQFIIRNISQSQSIILWTSIIYRSDFPRRGMVLLSSRALSGICQK